MVAPALQNLRRKANRALDVSPHLLRNPSHIVAGVRGVHIGILESLDMPWLREIGFTTVLDVGANTGQFARAAHYVFPSARIYAFEPLPSCLTMLRSRMAGVEGFTAFETAVGNEDGEIVIHENPYSPSSSVLPMTRQHTEAFPWTAGGQDITVEMHRLDHFLPQMHLTGKVLLKIDVQGFSQPVLEGAPETLKHVDTVIVETSFVPLYEGEASFDQTYRFMTHAGFEFVGLLDQLKHPTSGQILQGDAIFRRPQP